MAPLTRLLAPRHLAVFGGAAAGELVRQSRKIGFTGQIWPIHPRHSHVADLPAFPSLNHLPAIPDAAFIGVNRHASIDIMRDLAAIGCGGAVAYASGFAEAGAEGTALQKRLHEAAGNMPFFGPNCYGFINYLDRALIWPDQFGSEPVNRGVAIITQSGNIGLNLTMQRRALPIAYLITLGNQAGLDHAAAIAAVLDDPRVTAIGLHMEGIGNPAALTSAIARAHARAIPVIALKTGRTEAGAHIALSHTASLASADHVVDAFFRAIGIARVTNLPAFLESLKLLHLQGTLPGRAIASLSCSGGEAALIADTAIEAGLSFTPLTPHSQADIAATLDDMVSISNPLDYHTFGWRNLEKLTATFAAMMRAGADLTLLILDFPRPDLCDPADWDIAAAALAAAARLTGARAALLATLPECLPPAQTDALIRAGIVPLLGMSEAMQAIATAATCGSFRNLSPPALNFTTLPGDQYETFSEYAAKTRLAAHGLSIPAGALASSVPEALTIAETLGLPVAIKASGAQLAHKTELGAVKLNLKSPEAVAEAAAALLPLTGSILIERMIAASIAELIVGVARDPVLGLYLLLGSGGILAELVGDSVILLLPANRGQIEAALASLRVARLLAGHRGAPPADTHAAIDAILAIQSFALAHATTLRELDINPLMVCAQNHGAHAADMLLSLTPEPANV